MNGKIEKGPVCVFPLLGQSNMEGVGELAEFDNYQDERLLRIDPFDNAIEIAYEPLHRGKRNDRSSQCVGPGMPFGRGILDRRPDVKVALLNLAAGGTSLAQWSKGGTCYERAVEKIRAAKSHGCITGVLWHQGESDSVLPADAETYKDRFCQMLFDLRDSLGLPDLPIVAGQVGPFVETNTEWANGRGFPCAKIVNQQIMSLADDSERIGVISSEGTGDIGDGLHLDTKSQIMMGQRYAREMMRLAGI